jgi:hypothetical protein
MSTSKQAASSHGFLLSEEGHRQLQQLRDHAFLLAHFVFAATLDEEHTPLEIRRSMLGQLFDGFGERIDEVLDGVEWMGRQRSGRNGSPDAWRR